MQIINKLCGAALIMGTFLNLARMLPIYLNEGITLQNIPPVTVEQITLTSLLPGWLMSHMMGFFSAPILIIGFILIYQDFSKHRPNPLWLCSITMLSFGMLFYALAVGIDGIVLPQAAQQLLAASKDDALAATMLQTTVHAFAVGMGGLSLAATLAGVLAMSFGILRFFGNRFLGWSGLTFAGMASVGMLFGVVDIHMHTNFKLSAGVLFGAQFWLFLLGVYVYRGMSFKDSSVSQ